MLVYVWIVFEHELVPIFLFHRVQQFIIRYAIVSFVSASAKVYCFDWKTAVFGWEKGKIDVVILAPTVSSVVVILEAVVASIYEFPRVKYEFQFL